MLQREPRPRVKVRYLIIETPRAAAALFVYPFGEPRRLRRPDLYNRFS